MTILYRHKTSMSTEYYLFSRYVKDAVPYKVTFTFLWDCRGRLPRRPVGRALIKYAYVCANKLHRNVYAKTTTKPD